MRSAWDDSKALHLEAEGDLFQTATFAVAYVPNDPWKGPQPPRLIQQRGPRNRPLEVGGYVSVDEGRGGRRRAIIVAHARYHTGSVDEVTVLIAREFSGP